MGDPKVTLEEVRHVAKLARLELDEAEEQEMCGALTAILAHVAELDAFEVESVEPTFYPVELNAPLREDVVRPSLDRAAVLAEAPKTEEGAFSVPQVMEGEG